MSRRAFLRWVLGSSLTAGLASGGGAAYTLGVEPDWLAVEQVMVRVKHLPPSWEGLKIAHLSDLHWGPYTGQREIRGAVRVANAQKPDLVLLTGDYVLYSAEYAAPCARELKLLQAPLGVFAVPGNHDYWTDIDTVAEELQAAGVALLRNASRQLEVAGTPIPA